MHESWLTALIVSILLYRGYGGDWRWQKFDAFDEIDARLRVAQEEDCMSKSKDKMVLPKDTVTQLPKYNELLSRIFLKNRTSLLHLHNMAMNRAMFYSYILQKMNESASFQLQPNWMYMYMSVTADVNANPYMLNGSAIYFDTHCHYPNWYTTVHFNKTLLYFAPKAWRKDDTMDPDNLLREPTRRAVMVTDIGSGTNRNYTHADYKMNPWYKMWLPDLTETYDSLKKFTFSVGIKYSNVTGRFQKDEFVATNFFGPNSPGQNDKDPKLLPVRFTQPYFDCGKSNKWIVSAVAPIVDYMPRYHNWTHMRRQRFIGAVVMDIDFEQIDFNACPVSVGNAGPSYLSGISRCRPTTSCKHKSGFGFKRGGYRCKCRSGYRYPLRTKPHYQGVDVEAATKEEYESDFVCSRVQFPIVLPVVDNLVDESWKGGQDMFNAGNEKEVVEEKDTKYNGTSFNSRSLLSVEIQKPSLNRDEMRVSPSRNPSSEDTTGTDRQIFKGTQTFQNNRSFKSMRTKRSAFDMDNVDKMTRIFRHISSVNRNTCKTRSAAALTLPGDVSYGVDAQFKSQAATALRLAHFLSNFLQNANVNDNFGVLRGGGRLHQEHLFGEVLANVMGDFKILSSGVFYDTFLFQDVNDTAKEFFGPLAFRRDGTFYAIDSAGLSTRYTTEEWYRTQKERWQTNFSSLQEYKMFPLTRSDSNGTSSVKFEYFPMSYKAPAITDGVWTKPSFRCDGRVDQWVVTYVVPFFGLAERRQKLKFYGVVTVDVALSGLEINQCSQPFHIANAFKNTALCHYHSTRCTLLTGFPFVRGAYRCECRQGFEHPFKDGTKWFIGSLMDSEWQKKNNGLYSRFDTLKCRIAAGSTLHYSASTSMTLLILVFLVITR